MADHWKISRDEKLLRNHETREEDEFQLSLSQSVRREFLWIYDSRLVLRLEILRIASALKAPLCAIYVRFIPKIEKVFIASLYVVWSLKLHWPQDWRIVTEQTQVYFGRWTVSQERKLFVLQWDAKEESKNNRATKWPSRKWNWRRDFAVIVVIVVAPATLTALQTFMQIVFGQKTTSKQVSRYLMGNSLKQTRREIGSNIQHQNH